MATAGARGADSERYGVNGHPQSVEPPSELWAKADAEHPGDAVARRWRYLELMIEAGHVVIEPLGQEQYPADQPPSHINRHRYEG